MDAQLEVERFEHIAHAAVTKRFEHLIAIADDATGMKAAGGRVGLLQGEAKEALRTHAGKAGFGEERGTAVRTPAGATGVVQSGRDTERLFAKAAGPEMRCDHRVHFRTQRRIAGTRLVEVRSARRGVAIERHVERLGNLLPAIGIHVDAVADPFNAEYNHARATCQSRSTVATDTPRTCAVSSTDSPLKNRNS